MPQHSGIKAMNTRPVSALLLLGSFLTQSISMAANPKECPPPFTADTPVVPVSIEQADINGGQFSFSEISDHGERLFTAKFNICDGQGRPETTGGGEKRVATMIPNRAVPVISSPMYSCWRRRWIP